MKIRTLLESLDVAFSMYSAIPMPQIEWNERNMKYMMAFFPMVGVVQGALLLGFSLLAQALGLGFVLFAAVAALLPLFVTGGIHLDGFCDTVDALSSHQTREKKLDILIDPHTGALAVGGCLTVQMMAVGFVLSRSMSALSVVSFPCAKSSGLVHSFSSAAQKRNVRIAAAVFAAACVLLWLWIHPLLGAVLTGCCLLNFWYYYRMSQKQFGGITGDLAGYFLQLNEIIILLASVLYTLSAR